MSTQPFHALPDRHLKILRGAGVGHGCCGHGHAGETFGSWTALGPSLPPASPARPRPAPVSVSVRDQERRMVCFRASGVIENDGACAAGAGPQLPQLPHPSAQVEAAGNSCSSQSAARPRPAPRNNRAERPAVRRRTVAGKYFRATTQVASKTMTVTIISCILIPLPIKSG